MNQEEEPIQIQMTINVENIRRLFPDTYHLIFTDPEGKEVTKKEADEAIEILLANGITSCPFGQSIRDIIISKKWNH